MCLYRKYFEELELTGLAPYAVRSVDPKYRRRRSYALQGKAIDLERDRFIAILNRDGVEEPSKSCASPGDEGIPDEYGDESRYRTAFMIDGARVTSSKCFRRMEHKTQIFVSHVGDHYRTRLTHTLEVEGVSQLIARTLRLNTDLVRAIALAHDVGHTPSGHFGERTLNDLIASAVPGSADSPPGGFFHNIHGLRVVDFLEKGYEWDLTPPPEHDPPNGIGMYLSAAVKQAKGLDLTWAVREGILKHTTGGLDKLKDGLEGYRYILDEGFDLDSPGTLETQVVRWADDLASLMHDLEDGMRSGILSPYELIARIRKWGDSLFAKEGDMERSLGMSRSCGHTHSMQDSYSRRRVAKFSRAYRAIFGADIGEVDDGTPRRTLKYNIVAFLRSVFIANLIEQSHSNIMTVLHSDEAPGQRRDLEQSSGLGRDSEPEPRQMAASTKPPEDALIEITIGPAPDGQGEYMCTYAKHTRSGAVVPRSTQDYAILWINKHEDPRVTQFVEITLDGATQTWPVGRVFIDLNQVSLPAHCEDEYRMLNSTGLIGYDKDIDELRCGIKEQVIKKHLHNSVSVRRMDHEGKHYLERLFKAFEQSPEQLPTSSFGHYGLGGMSAIVLKRDHPEAFYLRIVEYLQGMTERYLEEEYSRLFLPGKSSPLSDERDLGDYIDPRLLDGQSLNLSPE